MDLGSINPVLLIASLMVASTPILLAAIGELVVERSGVLNLGVEGMMIVGAVAGFIATVETGSPAIGFVAGSFGAALLSLVFGVLTQVFLSNQVATGLGLTLFGLGISALMGQSYAQLRTPPSPRWEFFGLNELPVVGPILFNQHALVYLSLALVVAVWWFLRNTRRGMILRAVGENHDAAHALGYSVLATRFAAIAFGGACAGLGGAFLSLVIVPQWTDGMTAGRGWIALAIVVFASWKASRVLLGAYLFGGISVLQLNLQAAGFAIPVELLSMSPYLITILVLVIISSGRRRGAGHAPASLGRSFHASG
ncbi:MAG: ABC transporter permease [Pseudomonadota bacterium]